MMGLRKVYEEQTEKAKHEFMHLHSAKVIKFRLRLRAPVVLTSTLV